MEVSIILTIRQTLGSPRVELEGECESKHESLAMTRLVADIFALAKKFGGELLPERKEIPINKFFIVLKFPDDNQKRFFLEKLPSIDPVVK